MTRRRPGGEPRPGLVTFLLARADDDEAAALATLACTDAPPTGSRDCDDVAGHGPERVLREVAAKRAVARLWLEGLTAQLNDPQAWQSLHAVETVLSQLASVYSDHPDFQPAWLPVAVPAPPPPPRADNVIPFRVPDRSDL